ncbi:MAG: alkylhydroperoxidase-related (seleno)protein [Gammaproteobacteria bacterium]|nr:alkylhydroperoxidase-related (seleno)protein [Gammaproteobacteria bacterium]
MEANVFENCEYPIRQATVDAFAEVWRRLGESGPFWTGRDHMAMIREARQSFECELCRRRLEALSPNAVDGEHETVTDLSPVAVDVIHRIRTDPARMSRSVFENALANGMTDSEYIELIGVVATSVVIDTLHQGLGLPVPETLEGSDDPPTGQTEPEVVEDGAWVRLAPRDGQLNEVGIPRQANIIRAMGLVPLVIELFFTVMRQAYYITNLPISISRSQAEFIAARVSALNQCFY